MKHPVRILLIIVLASLLALPAIGQDELQEEPLLITFIPNIQFSPIYVAQAEGYFADAGFDVTVEYLNEPDVIDLVASDQAKFGIVSGEQFMLATSRGRPVTFVYEWFQEYPIGVVYDAELEVESMQDLAGLRVGIPGRFGANYTGLVTLLQAAEMEETEISVQEIGFAATEVFCVDGVDAAVVYLNNEPLQIQNRADKGDCGDVAAVNVLPVASAVDLVSNGIITSQEILENDPETVTAMVAAFDAALQLVVNNPARAYLISAPFIEGLPLDDDFRAALELAADQQDMVLEAMLDTEALYESHAAMRAGLAEEFDADTLLQFDVLLATIPLWNAEQLGYSDLESWENMQASLEALDQLGDELDVSAIYTNDFLPTAGE